MESQIKFNRQPLAPAKRPSPLPSCCGHTARESFDLLPVRGESARKKPKAAFPGRHLDICNFLVSDAGVERLSLRIRYREAVHRRRKAKAQTAVTPPGGVKAADMENRDQKWQILPSPVVVA